MDPNSNNSNQWNQFIRLGEMIGDGLHDEPGGKWISREYKRLSKILVPEIKEAEQKGRKLKNENINIQIQKLILEKKCKCGGTLEQSRSGSKILYCTVAGCKNRYKAI